MKTPRHTAIFSICRNSFPVNIILLAALLAGSVEGWCNSPSGKDNLAMLILLALVAGWDAIAGVDCHQPVSGWARPAAWLLLAIAGVGAWLPYTMEWSGALWFFVVAVAFCGYRGWRGAARMAPVLFLCLMVLPRHETLSLALSYPLRLLSTVVSAGVLELFHVPVTYQGTTIMAAGSEIAITDACSGISQLAVLVFLGYLLVRCQPSNVFWRTVYYFCLIPVIIAANGLRIILIVLLFLWLGEKAFHDPYHTGLGLLLVVTSVALFWGIGFLLPRKEVKK